MQLPPLQHHGSKLAVKSFNWFSGPHLIITLILAFCAASPAVCQISLPKDSDKPKKNEQALSILRQMAETYSRLPSLHQHSVYTSSLLTLAPEVSKGSLVGDVKKQADPAAPIPQAAVTAAASLDTDDDSPNRRVDRTVDLLFVQPNLLKITDSKSSATTPAETSTWVSDGKTYSAFVPRSHGANQLLYTQEKAPRSIRGFDRLQNLDGGSLELVMLMGINPFQNLTSDVVAVRVEEPAEVRGVQTDVITMISVNHSERDVIHLYIGKDDHLLHRLITEVSPTDGGGGTPRIGDALDEIQDESRPVTSTAAHSDRDHPLDAGDTSSGERSEAKSTRIVYDNLMTPVSHVERTEFAFTPPTGAALFMPVGSKQAINPNSKRLADMIRKSMQAQSKPVRDVTDVHQVSP